MLVAAPAVTEIGLEVRAVGQVGSWRCRGRSVEGARSAGWATWIGLSRLCFFFRVIMLFFMLGRMAISGHRYWNLVPFGEF